MRRGKGVSGGGGGDCGEIQAKERGRMRLELCRTVGSDMNGDALVLGKLVRRFENEITS